MPNPLDREGLTTAVFGPVVSRGRRVALLPVVAPRLAAGVRVDGLFFRALMVDNLLILMPFNGTNGTNGTICTLIFETRAYGKLTFLWFRSFRSFRKSDASIPCPVVHKALETTGLQLAAEVALRCDFVAAPFLVGVEECARAGLEFRPDQAGLGKESAHLVLLDLVVRSGGLDLLR